MSEPKRIQRKRTRGWRMPEGAVYVGRPSKWGNPYTLEMMRGKADQLREVFGDDEVDRLDPRALAAEAFRCDVRYGPDSMWWWFGPHDRILMILRDAHELAGHDLACWCPLEDGRGNRVPCHADVLLELANEDGAR